MSQTETEQLKLWQSEFGRSYTDRNDVPRMPRIAAWREVVAGITPCRVLEVGCNVGWNLSYLRANGWTDLTGVEPQPYAIAKARQREPNATFYQGTAFALPFDDGAFDLAFTAGVLIHIAPDTLGSALDEIYRVSKRYIIAIEYDASVETEIDYRGNAGALWKRDHGGIWQSHFPSLRLLRRLELGAEYDFDTCVAHVFEKV